MACASHHNIRFTRTFGVPLRTTPDHSKFVNTQRWKFNSFCLFRLSPSFVLHVRTCAHQPMSMPTSGATSLLELRPMAHPRAKPAESAFRPRFRGCCTPTLHTTTRASTQTTTYQYFAARHSLSSYGQKKNQKFQTRINATKLLTYHATHTDSAIPKKIKLTRNRTSDPSEQPTAKPKLLDCSSSRHTTPLHKLVSS